MPDQQNQKKQKQPDQQNQQNQSLISIIIPTLNEEKNITRLLDSLQSLSGVEIIVCDGGSSDATLKICRGFPVRVLSSQAGRGIQLNTGAQSAQGEIFLFLHADSMIENRILDDIRNAVTQGSGWGCCTLGFSERTPLFFCIAFLSNLRAKVFSSCYGDQGIYCQRDLFRRNGGFPETIFLEDIMFSHRLRCQQRARVVEGIIFTSTRRFRKAGVWRTIGKMQMIKFLYAMGIKPERLWRWFKYAG
ncbi:MAG: TIGR04283 family arsenosugar biosynthesis glycosyltransferase [Syntrophomonadaceae bacterium]|nr:TIGR04283 family arsenosugar biosynthesis glycosyltransferase [Syntrophomonadaceae bacterium]